MQEGNIEHGQAISIEDRLTDRNEGEEGYLRIIVTETNDSLHSNLSILSNW